MTEIVAVTFTEKAAGELKLRLREALEHERARRGRRATSDSAPPRACARDARRSARQHHPRLLRRSAARAAGRGARRSAVHRADRAAGGPPVRARVSRLAAGGARGSAGGRAPRAAPVRARRRSAARDGEGPIDRLRRAGRPLAEWRDFPAPWHRPPFDRDAEIDRLVAALHRLADLTARAVVAARQPVHRHRCRPPPEPPDRAGAVVRPARPRRLGGAAGRSRARPRVLAHAQGQRLQVRQGRRRAPRCSRRGTRCSPISSSSSRTPTPTWPPPAAGAGRRDGALSGAQGRGRRARLRRSAGAGARSHPRRRTRSGGTCRRSSSGSFVDEFQDTDPVQAEILLLLAADDPDVTRRPRTSSGARQALHRRRSEAGDLPVPRHGCRDLLARQPAARASAAGACCS